MKSPLIKKSSGELVPFSPEKLRISLSRSGSDKETINNIVKEVEKNLYDGIPTRNIYRQAFAMLKSLSKPIAAKYKLKQAIMELGPTGFPFEILVSAILNEQGYQTKVGEIVMGLCVKHEVDVIASKGDKYYMIECKYHNQPGTNCDVKVPLYINSRFKDIEQQWLKHSDNKNKFEQGWIITNTKFTSDAIQYGTCAGLKLMGWDYPFNAGLREKIDSSGLYPITCLISLTTEEKQKLLNKNIVLCKELQHNPELLSIANISNNRRSTIIIEVNTLCEQLKSKKKNKG